MEAQLDKTNGSKPSFERDPVRARKNQNLLAGFFADNWIFTILMIATMLIYFILLI